MPASREDVLSAVASASPGGDHAAIQRILDTYGSRAYDRERERVQRAIVALSAGSEDRLRDFVDVAMTDYRDVLGGQATVPPLQAEGEKLRQAALDLIVRHKDKYALRCRQPSNAHLRSPLTAHP